jgi:UDP:flavonoid glycosyltransferase YjiC (YdhE family)
MHRQPTVAVFPEPGAWGPTNNLVAMADHLREHGIRVVFLVEESFRGELEKRDFEESVLRMTPPPEHEEDVGEGWAEFVRAIAPEFRKPTIEQLETVTRPFWVELVAGAKYAHERLMAIWDEVRPDVIVSRQRHRLPGRAAPRDERQRSRRDEGGDRARAGLGED